MTQAPGSPPPKRSSDNLQPAAFPELKPSDQDPELQALYVTIVEKMRQSIHWYGQSKHRYKRWGLLLRLSAVCLAGLASITPIIIAMGPEKTPGWDPVRWVPLASLLAAVSAGCIGLDKLLGYSSSWLRSLPTMLELEAQLEALQFAWTRRALEARQLQLSPQEQLTASLNLLQEALARMQQIIKLETMEWVTQFSGSLQEFEKTAAVQRAALAPAVRPATGALKLEISNFDSLAGHSYEVQLGDMPVTTHQGATAAFTGLTPGQFKLRVCARREGHPVFTEDVVTVQPGETAAHKLTLP